MVIYKALFIMHLTEMHLGSLVNSISVTTLDLQPQKSVVGLFCTGLYNFSCVKLCSLHVPEKRLSDITPRLVMY